MSGFLSISAILEKRPKEIAEPCVRREVIGLRVCRDCGREFNPKLPHNKPGYIDQCGACSKDVEKYVGRNKGEKSVQIEIFRTRIEYWRRQLRRENAVGYNANLPVSNPTFVAKERE